jgi:hypothetical protein
MVSLENDRSTVASVAPLKGGATLRYACVPVATATKRYATLQVLQNG